MGHSSDCWKAWAAWINRLCCPSEGIHCRGSVVSPHLERHFTSTNTVVSPWRETMSSSERHHRQALKFFDAQIGISLTGEFETPVAMPQQLGTQPLVRT